MRCDAVTRAAGAGLVMRACLILLAMGFVEQTAAATARQFLVQSYTCFDEQLAEIETGTVDSDEGIPSAEDFGRELSALSARLKDRQPMAFPAVVACQALGRLFPPLQRHWSAHRQDFALVLSPDLEPHRQVLSSLTERAMRHLRSQFDTQWPLAVTVVVSNDFASIRRFLTGQGAEPWEIEQAELTWLGICQKSGSLAGHASAVRVNACITDWAKYPTFDDPEVMKRLQMLLVHELMHSYQTQSMGAFSGTRYQETGAHGWPGPEWLQEGLAEYAAERMFNTAGTLAGAYQATIEAYGYDRVTQCKIRIRQRASYETISGPAAVVKSNIAQLERTHGAHAFSRFYMEAGLSHDWQSTFAAVFGGTPDEVFGCVE